YWKANDNDDAERELKQSVALNPDNIDALYKLGSFYVTQEHADLAKQYLDAALDLDPAIPEAHFMLGKAALLGTNDNEAEEQFKLAIAPDPKSSTAEFAYYQ